MWPARPTARPRSPDLIESPPWRPWPRPAAAAPRGRARPFARPQDRGGLFGAPEFNDKVFRIGALRALKGAAVVALFLGLNRGKVHLRPASQAQSMFDRGRDRGPLL